MPWKIIPKPEGTEKTKRFKINLTDWKETAKNIWYFAVAVWALAWIYAIDLYMSWCFEWKVVWSYFYSVFAAWIAFSLKRFLTDYSK